MMTDRELMQQALSALVTAELDGNCEYGATDALRARLAQPEPEHDFYTTADKDRPEVICDRNGEVVLNLCKRCGKGEADLIDEPCGQPEPEPVAWMDAPERIYLQVCDDENCDLSFEAHDDVLWCQDKINDCDILYVRSDTAQPQREWQGLTVDEFYDLDDVGRKMILEYGRLVEAKLKEKNGF
jgi:hypothetical protein